MGQLQTGKQLLGNIMSNSDGNSIKIYYTDQKYVTFLY